MENKFSALRRTVTVGGKEITFETGRLANHADGSIWIQTGGTVVLVTACTQKTDRDLGFFPLTVEYTEKMYAAGRIPGSFFRREMGRPSERETLCARVIDRPIRPMFPKGFRDEVQILSNVISSDQLHESDVLALTGASAALSISSVPFNGPIAGARVCRVNGEFLLNPNIKEQEGADLNLIFAASRDAVVMVEGQADFVSEEVVAEALSFGHKGIEPLFDVQDELRNLCGKAKIEFTAPVVNEELKARVEVLATDDLKAALQVADKMERKVARKAVKVMVMETLSAEEQYIEDPSPLSEVGELLSAMEKTIVRTRIHKEGLRIDGRDATTVRPIITETGVLPRAHGSSIFARGETKSLVVATLGSTTDEQRMDSLMGDVTKRFMLHYNFAPYCVGEVKMVRVTRREVGHGALAERALRPVLPSSEDFPFTIRIVSETLESNGSSSMAAVTGGCLSLMDAGVPIKAPVAGIAMGLIKEGDDYIVLTDILGDEDALGDMDFKIAGTAEGITAVQMDIKIAGIPSEIMVKALKQARDARIHILNEMAKELPASRDELSKFAPQIATVEVNPDVIRVIIGPGGKNIKAITAATGASVDIEDSGKVTIFAPTLDSLELAREMVQYYDQHAEVGKDYNGKVKKILEIGAIVEILPNLEALVHISQLDIARVEKVEDLVSMGEDMKVKVIEINDGRVRASRKAVLLEAQGTPWTPEATARPQRRPGGRDDRRGGGGGRDDRRGGGRDDRRGGRR